MPARSRLDSRTSAGRSVRLRPVERRDLETVRRLRNQSRASFFDTREIPADRQSAWFESLAGKPVAFYVIEVEGVVAGTISVSDRTEGREVGNLVLDPAYRGRGFMRQVVEQLTTSPGTYFADVKSTNEASLRVFRATGFSDLRLGESIRLQKQVG